MGFSEALFAVEEDDPLLADSATVVAILLSRPAWVTDQQGEVIIERAVLREFRESNTAVAEPLVSLLIAHFPQLESWSLRALVLKQAGDYGVTGTAMAAIDSARRISALLRESRDGYVHVPYELEAVALAAVAPLFPSAELAELLRTVAMYSADRTVVAAATASARTILGANSGQ